VDGLILTLKMLTILRPEGQMAATARCRVMDVMGGITATVPPVSTVKLGAGHCWGTRAHCCGLSGNIRCGIEHTYCSYGMYSPIWDVSGAPGGAE